MFKAHLFICLNAPENNAKCGSKGSEKLHAEVKEKCSKETWAKEVRINKSGCLGKCEKGIVAVLYPSGKWFTDVKETDADMLFNAVKEEVLLTTLT